MWKAVVITAVLGALVFAGFRSGVIERYFLYYPIRAVDSSPGDYGLAFDDVSFAAEDGTQLHGWFVPGREEGHGDVTWLWFHGNAGNISHRLDNLRRLRDELGVSVFLFDYRGYGRSDGSPSEQGMYLDAQAALAYLRSREDVRDDSVVYFGRSLGAAVATWLAAHEPPYALILESPFPSVPYMARELYPFLPVGRLLRTRYDTLATIPKTHAPLLVLHGERDEIVPFEAGYKVYEAANDPKRFYRIPGAGHNDTYIAGGRDYFSALQRFLEDLAR